ncbi:hypothetical protein PMAYCL1PPCAC_26416, partial [Pristionchus mayeri]
SGFSPGAMSLYTVEQLELLRRLKATGITVQAIVDVGHVHAHHPNLIQLKAFNEMNSVTTVLDAIPFPQQQAAPAIVDVTDPDPASGGPSPSVVVLPTTTTMSLPGPSLLPVQVPAVSAPPSVASIETTLASLMPSPAIVTNPMFFMQGAPMPLTAPSSMLHNSLAAAMAAAQAAAAAQQQQQQRLQLQQRLQTPPAVSSSTSASASTSNEVDHSQRPPRTSAIRCTPMREITTLDNPKELEDFMSQGEEGCIADMKAFITHYSLRQTTVAMMTGVSQPYISKLLNGNHRELSLRCRKNIYCWYLNCRRHPEKLSSFLADPSSRLETNAEGDLVPQKRERYVFRPVLLRLLEQCFSETPFPDTTRRQEIANACNAALIQDKKGVPLMPKEVVSPQVVSNWFANKRKELRRKNGPVSPEATHGVLYPALIEALERGAGSVPEQSETGSASPPNDE